MDNQLDREIERKSMREIKKDRESRRRNTSKAVRII